MFLDLIPAGERLEDDDVQRRRDQGRGRQADLVLIGIDLVLRQPVTRAVAPGASKVIGFEGRRKRYEDQRDEPQRTDPRDCAPTQAYDRPPPSTAVHARQPSKIRAQ